MDNKTIHKIIRDFVDGILPARYNHSFIKWLTSDSDQSEKGEVMKEIWDTTEGNDVNIEEQLELFRNNRKEQKPQTRVIFRIMRYAAIFLLPIATALIAWQLSSRYYQDVNEMAELTVPDGTKGRVILSDGSEVVINGGTTLLYPRKFVSSNRDVYLQGEAHFKVTKDEDHPFIVHTGDLKTKVLGTHFNIKAYSDDENITTTLEEGGVRVSTNHASITLKPDQQAIYNKLEGKLSRVTVNAEDYGQWVEGGMNFRNATLKDILNGMRHHYNVRFIVSENVDLTKRYTMSSLESETVEDVIKVITKISKDIKYQINGKTIKLYDERKEVLP